MNRRGFLGSLAGLAALVASPRLVEETPPPPPAPAPVRVPPPLAQELRAYVETSGIAVTSMAGTVWCSCSDGPHAPHETLHHIHHPGPDKASAVAFFALDEDEGVSS